MTACRSVALVVIARDEAPRIERLLRSVAPWVDRMVVLDTGSDDDTVNRARACGADVAESRWPDDFAAARNLALAHAGADWHVVLDADEWLIDGGPELQALRHLEPDFVGAIQFEDRHDDAPGSTVNNWISRVIPGALRYQGRIHEQVDHHLPVRRLAVRVGHDGYTPLRLEEKRGRNRALLARAVAEHPGDAYLWYQLGKDHAVYAEHEAAEAAFSRAAGLADAKAPWWGDLVVRRLFTLKSLKRHAQAMDFGHEQMQPCAELPDFFFALGDLLLDLAADRPQEARSLLPMIEDAWRRCLVLGERPDLPNTVTGRGSYLAAFNLGLVLDGTGRADEAQGLRARYPVLARPMSSVGDKTRV